MTEPLAAAKTAEAERLADLVVEYETSIAEVGMTSAFSPSRNYAEKGLDIIRDGFEQSRGGAEFRSMLLCYQLKQLFFTEDWVFILLDLIASKISSQPLRVVRKVVKNGKIIVEQAEGHQVQSRIDNPNPYQDYASWMYCMVIDEAGVGNSVVWKADNIQQLVPLPAELIRLDINPRTNQVRYFVQQVGDIQSGYSGLPAAVFTADQIIHIRRPNPSALLWGMSPLVPAEKAVNFNRYTSDYLNTFYERGATPQMALSMDKDANEKVALRLLRSFESAYAGRRNSRRTLQLPKGVSVTTLSHKIAEQELIDLITTNRETLLNIWKVPKHELSLAETGSLGSEEAKQALKNFWAACLKPIMGRIAGTMTKAFQSELGQGFALEFDLSDVEVLREDEVRKAELAKAMLSTHTLNEVRARVYDDPPLPGGDALPQMAQGGQNQNPTGFWNPGQSQPDQGDGGAEGKAITVEAKAGEGVQTTDIANALSPAAEGRKAFAAKIKAEGGWYDQRRQKYEALSKPHVEGMKKLALPFLKDFGAASVKAVTAHLKSKDYRPIKTKADDDTPDPKVTIPSKAALRKSLRDAYSNFEQKWTDDAVSYLESSSELGYDLELDVPFKIPDKIALEAIRTEGKDQRRAILEDRELKTFAWMSETQTEDIMQLVENGVQKGLTVQKVAETIANRFTDIANIESRALVIARTETGTAQSIGQAAGMYDLSKVVPDLQKTWLATHDDRTRPAHAELDGETVPVDKAFSNGLQYPRDPRGEAADTIQCRCGFVTLPKDFQP